MFHTYEEALEWIHARLRLGIKPGLKRMEWMMEKLGHPERRLKTVHIGGTNGKGSTVTYLRCMLEEAKYKVGTFTSPYIEQFNERISVNGNPIADEDIVKLINIIKPLSDELENTELGAPTEFEVITAMSMYYFAHINPVDVVLYEVGLGGRFDSTNIIYPLVSIITSIGLDHTSILGETHSEIAFEKAGIIKNGVSIVTAVDQEEALKVIEQQAEEKKAPLYVLGRQFYIENHESIENGEQFTVKSMFQSLNDLKISMMGKHQTQNASLAVLAAQLLNNFYSFLIEEEHIKEGLKKAHWPGRFEVISEQPLVIIDGAHNEEGIYSLFEELNKRYKNCKKRFVFAALKDKKLNKMISYLDQMSDKITFVDFDYPRAAKAAELFEISGSNSKHISEDWKSILKSDIRDLEKNEMLVVTGSLYFISEVRPYVLELLKN